MKKFLFTLALLLASPALADGIYGGGGGGGGGTPWPINPVTSYNASGINNTVIGSMTASSAVLTIGSGSGNFAGEYPGGTLANGMTVTVVGAGPASANLTTTVQSGGGTNSLTLAATAGTSVTNAAVYEVGAIQSGSNKLSLTSTQGWASGQGVTVAGAGASTTTVALDANASSVATSAANITTITNSNLTVGSGSNRCLVAQFISYNSSNSTISGLAMTWNGTAMTQIGTTTVFDGTNVLSVYLFGLVNPASGNNSAVATWTNNSNNTALNVTSFTGCNQTGGTTTFAHFNSQSEVNFSDPVSLPVVSPSGNLAIDVAVSSGGLSAPTQTQLFSDINTGGGSSYSTGTNPTFGWTNAGGFAIDIGMSINTAVPANVLNTTVSAVTSSGLTLAANASATSTNGEVNHDDTVALNNATKAGSMLLPLGYYNITAAVSPAASVQCASGTVIINRGVVNDFFDITSPNSMLLTAVCTKRAMLTPRLVSRLM